MADAAPDLTEILGRDLNARLPGSLRQILLPDERAVVVVGRFPATIAATTQRVLVSPHAAFPLPIVLPYSALTGAKGTMAVIGRRYIALSGAGLNDHPNAFELGLIPNATLVQLWDIGAGRKALAELGALIPAMRARIEAAASPAAAPALPGDGAPGREGAIGSFEFVSSYPGYSLAGRLLTVGWLPWILLVLIAGTLSPWYTDAIARYVILAIAAVPGALWVAAKLRGAAKPFGWFYRPPSQLQFDPSGVSWRNRTGPAGPIPWIQINGVRRGAFGAVLLTGPAGERVAWVPADLRSVQTSDHVHQATFAMALVASRLDRYTLVGSNATAARLRSAGEAPSSVVSQAPQRVDPGGRAVAGVVVAVVLATVVRAIGSGTVPSAATTPTRAPAGTLAPIASWTRQTAPGGDFSILLPDGARAVDTIVPASSAPIPMALLDWVSADATSEFTAAESPVGSSAVTDPTDALINARVDQVGAGTILYSTNMVVAGYPAVDFSYGTHGHIYFLRYIIGNGHLYQLAALGTAVDHRTADAFFDTIEFPVP